jgi:DNA-binding transcriptional regulator YdaS (Cro superfamily)
MNAHDEAQERGIAAAVRKAGGVTQLAHLLGVSHQVVSRWLQRGYVPYRRVLEIEAQLGIDRQALIAPRLRDLMAADVFGDNQGDASGCIR